jgi:hypothetical protein
MVLSFFKRRDTELRMPKREPGSADGCGIRFQGAVSNGELSVQEALSLDARRLTHQRSQSGGFADPSQDPVLRSHLGLDRKR